MTRKVCDARCDVLEGHPIITRCHTRVALTSGQGHPARPRPCKHGEFGRSREAQTGDDTAWPVARGGGHETETSSAPMFNGFWHVMREMKRRYANQMWCPLLGVMLGGPDLGAAFRVSGWKLSLVLRVPEFQMTRISSAQFLRHRAFLIPLSGRVKGGRSRALRLVASIGTNPRAAVLCHP